MVTWLWSALACTRGGAESVELAADFQAGIVLPDEAVVLGGDSALGTLDGWRIDGDSPSRLAPNGPGSFVAADSRSGGLVAVSAQTNGAEPQLWTWNGSGWAAGPAIPHGPVRQLMATDDGALWTEGEAGVHRSTDDGATWARLPVRANLRLGSVKLGHTSERVVFAGMALMSSSDDGQSWSTLYEGAVATTDGTWVAAPTDKPSLRIGRIDGEGVVWTSEIDGQWFAAEIRGHSTGVRVVATKALATDAVLFEASAEGKSFSKTRIKGPASAVGLGETAMWVDDRGRLVRQ